MFGRAALTFCDYSLSMIENPAFSCQPDLSVERGNRFNARPKIALGFPQTVNKKPHLQA